MAHKMNVREAATALHDDLSHYPWLASVGIGKQDGGDETLYIYVTTKKNKVLDKLRSGYLGFPVVIKKTEQFRPALR